MKCPYCQTENRENRERCYHCDKDISMLRLIANKARHHYNVALEHAERGRTAEAIDELHNAIDLDRGFSSAHVVLGTLYAKSGNFDRAREAWRMALDQQPELAKAHQYLQRVETVEKSLPVLRRFRIASLVLMVATLVLGASYILQVREKPEVTLVRQAHQALSQNDYARSLDLLEAARRQARPGSLADVSATALHNVLQSELRQEVRYVQELKYRENYPEVLTAIAALQARRPDEATSAVLANIREDVNHYYATQLRHLFDEYTEGRVAYADFLAQAGEFLNAYPEVPEKQNIVSYLDQARELEAARRFNELLGDFLSTGDVEATVNALREAQEAFGGTHAAAAGRQETVDQLLTILFEEFQRLVDAQNYLAASEILGDIEKLAGEFRDVVDVRGPVNLASQVLEEVWRGARLKEVEQLVKTGDAGEAREALMLLAAEEETLPEAARELLARLELELAAREDVAFLEELREEKNQILGGGLDDAHATRTYALASALAERLEEPAEKSEALAYASGAAAQAGNYELAADLLEKARKAGKLQSSAAEALQKLFKRKPAEEKTPASKKQSAPKKKSSETRKTSSRTARTGVSIEPARESGQRRTGSNSSSSSGRGRQ